MKCLNDALIQSIVDHEASDDIRAHAASCEACAARVRDRYARSAALASMLDLPVPIPSTLERRVQRAVAESSSPAGATRLRPSDTGARGWRRTAWGTAAVALATLVVVVFVAPMVKGPTTVSAAEILAKSVSRLAQTATTGIELLQYELVLDGVPREMMPDHANGAYRVHQVIDHDSPGHYRYTSFGPDGRLLTSIAQDPVTRKRTSLLRVDDQAYRFEFAMPPGDTLSLPEIERLHMEASVMMMQASGQQVLQIVEDGPETRYRIEVPHVSASKTNAVWDLTHALVLVDAQDFRIREFSASGTFLKQPYSVSYRLISRVITARVTPDEFEVPTEAGQLLIAGEGTANPALDAFVGALRELTRLKQGR